MISRLNIYSARLFCYYLAVVLCVLFFLIFCSEFFELQRRLITPLFVKNLFFAFLKTPATVQEFFPLVIFFSACLLFLHLNISGELLTLFNCGLSIWQVLRPFLYVSFFLGVLNFIFFQPMSTLFLRTYYKGEARSLAQEKLDKFQIFSSGMWVKKNDSQGYFILHIKKLRRKHCRIENVSLYAFSKEGILSDSYYAPEGYIGSRELILKRGWHFSKKEGVSSFQKKYVPKVLNVEELFSQNFKTELLYSWSLPSIMKLIKDAGLSVHAYRLKFQGLLASVLSGVTLTFLACVLVCQINRQHSFIYSLLGAFLIGFFFYFLSQLMAAMGQDHTLPLVLMAWTPAILPGVMAFIFLLFWQEGSQKNLFQ